MILHRTLSLLRIPRSPPTSLCVGIIFIAYALQVKYKPFLDPNMDHATDVHAVTAEAKLVYVSPAGCRWPLTS